MVPLGGGTSVVGGVEARVGDRPVVSMDLRRLDRVLEVDAVSMGSDPGWGYGPRVGGAAAGAWADPAPFPPVVRVLDPGWVDRDPGRRALRDALHAHRRSGRVGAGDHSAGDLGEPAAAGVGGRALAGPDADRVGGDPRRDRRGLGAGAAATRVQVFLRGRVRRLHGRGEGRPRDLPNGAAPLELPAARRAGGGDGRGPGRGEEPLVLGLESAHHPVGAWMDLALEIAREHGGIPGEVRSQTPAGRGAAARARTRLGPGAAPSCWRRTCATPSSPAASSRRPSRRRSPGTASRSSMPM